jgi:nicotinamidase-related amidase
MIALLIIDMQKGMFTKETPRYQSDRIISNINSIANIVRSISGKVIFIQHDGNKEEGYQPNTEEWELIPEIIRNPIDIIIHKTACDSFYKSELEKYLIEKGINQLIITGCATDYCVDTTIKSATSKDYFIYVPSDGHTTANRPSIPAEQVISHYNWIWKNLILPNKNLKVLPTSELREYLIKEQKPPNPAQEPTWPSARGQGA